MLLVHSHRVTVQVKDLNTYLVLTDLQLHHLQIPKTVNSLPNNKILDWSKLKAFADDKMNLNEKFKLVLGKVENLVGKGGKCWLHAFSPFPTLFSKAFSFRVAKNWD